MRYGYVFPYAGARPLQEYFQGVNDQGGGTTGISVPSQLTNTPTYMPSGVIVAGFDNYWGGVEFQYCYFATLVPPWTPVTITPSNLVAGFTQRFLFTAAAVANTANQSRPMGVTIQNQPIGSFGWVAVSGLVPGVSNASLAANVSVGINAAGQLGASSAGKEIENAVVILPATTTVVKPNATVVANSPIVQFTGNNTIDGLFIGCALSGVGIPANAVVQNIDPDGRRVFMSTGPGVAGASLNATASGGISVTATYNDSVNFYNILQLNRPSCQGRIT